MQTPTQPTSWLALQELIAPISYAWPGWLPNGLVTLVAAQPGKGKSALALRLCQVFTQGTPWPDGTRYGGRRGKVLWCECESAQAINLQRAKDWGLRTDRIICPLPDGTKDVKLDDSAHREAIARLMAEEDVRFAVIDSLRGSHSGDENSSKSMEVLAWLAALARDTAKPVLVTHHLRKSTREEVTLDRVRGSSAIIQLCRLVWALDSPFEDIPQVVRVQAIKNNLGPNAQPLAFTISQNGLIFYNAPPSDATQQDTKPLARACALLKAILSASPVASTDVQIAAENAGISWATIKRAKTRLNVIATKQGSDGKWYWRLPDRPPLHAPLRAECERQTIFGIVTAGSLVLKTPKHQPRVNPPLPSAPASCANWLKQSICNTGRELTPYTDLIVVVPIDDPRAAEWNAALADQRFQRVPDERLRELMHEHPAAREANPEHVDMWILDTI